MRNHAETFYVIIFLLSCYLVTFNWNGMKLARSMKLELVTRNSQISISLNKGIA